MPWKMVLALVLVLLAGAERPAGAAERNVVVISVDGLPAYLLDDPRASLPVIRGLRASGVAAASGMRVANPSVTWPNHTTLMTGVYPERHGVLYNGRLERGRPGEPVRLDPRRTQDDLVQGPLLFDRLKEAGAASAAINWPCTRGSRSLADNFPDVPEELKYTTQRLKDELAARGLLAGFERGSGVVRDEVWTEAACQALRARKPRLLVLHLLNLDSTHHRHGPRSAEGYTAAALCDALVGRVLAAIEQAGLKERTTVLVLADHGFAAVKKTLRPNAVLRREGLLKADGPRIVSARVQVVPEGGIGMVYLTDPATADQDRAAVLRLFRGAEGVAAVLEPADFARYHLPNPGTDPEMADLVLAARDGYTVSGTTAGDTLVETNERTTGSHGYLATEPRMNALFVASGPGIKAGSKLEGLDNVDVAPTVARLLGVPLEGTDGRVLSEILAEGD